MQLSNRDNVITSNVMIHVLYPSAAALWKAKSNYIMAVHKGSIKNKEVNFSALDIIRTH